MALLNRPHTAAPVPCTTTAAATGPHCQPSPTLIHAHPHVVCGHTTRTHGLSMAPSNTMPPVPSLLSTPCAHTSCLHLTYLALPVAPCCPLSHAPMCPCHPFLWFPSRP